MKRYRCSIVLFWWILRSIFAQDDANTLVYDEYEYQWVNESLVETCPPANGPLPFRLGDPTIDARTKGVILGYPILIPDPGWLSFQVMDASCNVVIPTGSGNEFPFTSKVDVTYDDSSTAKASLQLEINPYGLSEYGSIFYLETERSGDASSIESRGDVQVCVRMSLWNGVPGSSSEANEVTFSETELTFGVRFTAEDASYLDFTTKQEERTTCTGSDCGRTRLLGNSKRLHASYLQSPVITPNLPKRTYEENKATLLSRYLCETSWGVQVFTCPEDMDLNSLVTISGVPNNMPIPSSVPVRLCIQPNEVASQAGATLKDVESLYFKTSTVTQPAVEAGYISFDGLSAKECGGQLCVVETNLYPEIAAQGSVTIAGKVLFQPSQATSYNQIMVNIGLQLEVEPNTSASTADRIMMRGSMMIGGAPITIALLRILSPN